MKKKTNRHFHNWRQARLFLLNGGNLEPEDYPRRQPRIEEYRDLAPETGVEIACETAIAGLHAAEMLKKKRQHQAETLLADAIFGGANSHPALEFYRFE